MVKVFFILINGLLSLAVYAKIEAYNYNFSIDMLDDFAPEKKLSDIEKKFKPKTVISNKGDYKILKYLINEQRYVFPIFVQFYKDAVVDSYIRLPSYFIHDIFHESLIKKLGKQDKYIKHDESASYMWKNAKNFKHYYRAECTITCFPIFYSIVTNKSDLPGYKSILSQMLSESSWE